MKDAEKLAQELRIKFELSYKCAVNLEAAINNALLDKLPIMSVKQLLEDVIENIEFVPELVEPPTPKK